MGVEAQKQERLWKKRVRALLRADNPIPLADQAPILDPEAGSDLEPEFELELDPGSQLARQLQYELEEDGEWEGE